MGADFASVYAAIRLGNSVVLDCDVGLTDAQQRRFIGAFAALHAAIKPSPQCILVRGSLLNRRVLDSGAPINEMADAKLKATFEDGAEWLHRLAQRDVVVEMETVSALAAAPVAAFVVVMEAVVILLTPSKRYEPPKPQPSGVSWRLGRRLLATPSFLLARLQAVKYASVTAENLVTLQAYLRHDCWPRAALSHAVPTGSQVLHALASWVECVVACAVEGQQTRNGLAPPISRTHPVAGLFGSVIEYRNVPDLSTQRELADAMADAEQHAYEELLDAALVDVRVYRKCHGVSDPHVVGSRGRRRPKRASSPLETGNDRERQRRCLVHVFHDCERIFLSAYDPATSFRWQAVVEENDVDALLAPNSIERADTTRTPPATRQEMYDRLVQLCLLEPRDARRSSSPALGDELFAPPALRLDVRPSAVRLCRRVLRLGGRLATVTMAELSRGRIQVDVFLHDRSLELRRVVSLESVLERLSHRDARNVFVPPERLPAMVLDRLRLFRREQSAEHGERSSATTRLGVITRESAPGRVLLRRAVRSAWLARAPNSPTEPRAPAVWLLTVVELHGAHAFSVEVYQPRTSHRFSLRLSRREFEDLALESLCSRSAPSQPLLRRVLRELQFDCALDDAADDPANVRVAGARVRQILARAPLSMPFVSNPHHVVEARRVQRAYLQAEMATLPDDASELRLRVCLPESCEEQALRLDGAQIDHALSTWAAAAARPVPTAAWASAPLTVRKSIAMCVARTALRWDPDGRRVRALLPSGAVDATVCTRDTGVAPAKPPAPRPARTKRSLFVARSSQSMLPTPSSCVRLLDADDRDVGEPALYLYDREELVHKGSYRANGVLVVVQVFMKAVIFDVLQPRLPVDRVAQQDSFELVFHFYHPGASAAARCVIRGRRELRQVVGPDRAELIRSASVHELLEHVIENRSVVQLETSVERNREVTRLRVAFLSDRLYAKQKATPVNESLLADQRSNEPKLIDARELRGVKLLSKARVLDGVPGRTIFTVFDVSATQPRSEPDAYRGVQLRVDAYIIATSERLSLSLEAADLTHVVGEDVELLAAEALATSDERRQRLAAAVIEHVAIERRHDGTLDRLYLRETLVIASPSPSPSPDNSRLEALGKTVRRVHDERRQVVVSPCVDRSSGSLTFRFYDPQHSASSTLAVSRQTLALVLGLEDAPDVAQALLALDARVKTAVVDHLVSLVVLEVHGDGTVGGRLAVDDDSLSSCRAALSGHTGDSAAQASGEPPQRVVQAEWRGLLVLERSQELCAAHLTLEQQVPPPRKPPVRQHTESALAENAADAAAAPALQLDATWRLLVSLLPLRRARAETFDVAGDSLQQAIGADAQYATPEQALREIRARLRVSNVFAAPASSDESQPAETAAEAMSWRRCRIEWGQAQ
ncbi:hypothetical protein ATCC90586_003672 [Pythium insidiosum]|nr:hypothetical protein ATCC90586_003672 [Pythium insidiosum]